MNIFYHDDEYGVRNYHDLPILLVSFVIFFMIVALSAKGVLYYEIQDDAANISNYTDSFWLCFMAASTIGFGDYYPITTGGRVIIGSMFILGGVMLGTIIGLVADMVLGFTDTNVKNRELRQQIDDLTNHNEKLEVTLSNLDNKLEILMKHVDDTTPELKMEKYTGK